MKSWVKKLALTGILAAVVVTSLSGCGNSGSKDAAQQKKELIVGTEPSFAPFEFPDGKDGEITGFDMDLIKAMAKKMGYEKVTIKGMGFDALFPAMNAGQIDVAMAGMSITEERKKQFLFTDPYYESGLMTIVRKDNTVIHSLADLKGKRIGVQLGTTAPRKPKRLKVPRSRILTRRTLLAWNLKTAMWTPLSVTCRYWSISLKRAALPTQRPLEPRKRVILRNRGT